MAQRDAHVFLSGQGRDAAGRTIETVLAFDDRRLESAHDYIQWLFPLTEPSAAVPGSPVLGPADVAAIRADADAGRNLDRAATLMRGFYDRTSAWLVPHDHNHLRITRILRSLTLLRDPATAEAFLRPILQRNEEAGSPVSSRSLGFWRQAFPGRWPSADPPGGRA